MILGIDIGNSNIVIGYIENEQIMDVFRLETDTSMSVNEYYLELTRVIENKNLKSIILEGAILSSVVSSLTPVLSEVIKTLTGFEPMVVNYALKSGLNFSIDRPEKIGTDRISDCIAAAAKYPLPAVVIDFGTATTFSVIGANSTFLGGSISPGLKTSVKALSSGTSQLSPIKLDVPSNCIGKDTNACINTGIVLGTACMVDGMIERIEKELGTNVTVVATGGLAHLVIPNCLKNLIYDENLLLYGLALIFEKNRN